MSKFDRVTIQNFRGIRKAEIDGLKEINLFFGKNNCGKSSLLEAVFILTGQSNPLLPVSVNQLRNYSLLTEKDILLDFYNLNAQDTIRLLAEGEEGRALEISVYKGNDNHVSLEDLTKNGFNTTSVPYGLQLDFWFQGKKYQSSLSLKHGDESNGRIQSATDYKESIVSQYLPSSYMQVAVLNSYGKIVENKQEGDIIKILQDLEPKIRDVQLVGNNLFVDIGLHQRLPLNVMGDGLRKLMAIVLAIYGCKGGMLFIDEIDNGFHFSAMPNLWKAVCQTCRITNTQLFVSTHNMDSLKGLVSFIKDGSEEFIHNISAYKLIKTDKDIVKAVRYDASQLSYAVEQEIEVR